MDNTQTEKIDHDIHIKLTEKQYELLRVSAFNRRIPISLIIRLLVDHYLEDVAKGKI